VNLYFVLSILLGIRNVSDKSCTENQNTHFIVQFLPRKSCLNEMWKHTVQPEAADDNKAHAHCMFDS